MLRLLLIILVILRGEKKGRKRERLIVQDKPEDLFQTLEIFKQKLRTQTSFVLADFFGNGSLFKYL